MVYLALLRGINVGGHQKIKMTDLKLICEGLGWTGVQTYIQSGNVVFSAPETPKKNLAAALSAAILAQLGLSVTVIVRSLAEWQALVAQNPLAGHDPKQVVATLLAEAVTTEALTALETDAQALASTEQWHFLPDVLYLYYPDGQAKTKLTNEFWEKRLKVAATTRNWNTVLQLLALGEGASQ